MVDLWIEEEAAVGGPLEADLSWVLALMIPFTTAALGSPPAKPEALERCEE